MQAFLNRVSRLVGLTMLLPAAVGGCDSGMGRRYANSYLGQSPPELATAGTWINSDGPVTLTGLRGRVVWLQFSFLR